ncbi:Placental protein 11, partial [Aphelenchoides avenae]
TTINHSIPQCCVNIADVERARPAAAEEKLPTADRRYRACPQMAPGHHGEALVPDVPTKCWHDGRRHFRLRARLHGRVEHQLEGARPAQLADVLPSRAAQQRAGAVSRLSRNAK